MINENRNRFRQHRVTERLTGCSVGTYVHEAELHEHYARGEERGRPERVPELLGIGPPAGQRHPRRVRPANKVLGRGPFPSGPVECPG